MPPSIGNGNGRNGGAGGNGSVFPHPPHLSPPESYPRTSSIFELQNLALPPSGDVPDTLRLTLPLKPDIARCALKHEFGRRTNSGFVLPTEGGDRVVDTAKETHGGRSGCRSAGLCAAGCQLGGVFRFRRVFFRTFLSEVRYFMCAQLAASALQLPDHSVHSRFLSHLVLHSLL